MSLYPPPFKCHYIPRFTEVLVSYTKLRFHTTIGRNICLSPDHTIAIRLKHEFCKFVLLLLLLTPTNPHHPYMYSMKDPPSPPANHHQPHCGYAFSERPILTPLTPLIPTNPHYILPYLPP